MDYDLDNNFSFRKIFQPKKSYIVLRFLDLNIKNPSDFYTKYEYGQKDGF